MRVREGGYAFTIGDNTFLMDHAAIGKSFESLQKKIADLDEVGVLLCC